MRGVQPRNNTRAAVQFGRDITIFSEGLVSCETDQDKKNTNGLWCRVARWLNLPQLQAMPVRPYTPRIKPGTLLEGEASKFYNLLDDYASSVYSGRLNAAALDYFNKTLDEVDTTRLPNEDKAYHLMFSHDVDWRRAMQQYHLQAGYDTTLQAGKNRYNIGSPQNWVKRILDRPANPFRFSPEKTALQKRTPGIGKQVYEAILEHQLYAGMDSETLIKTASNDYDDWQSQMNDLAREIDPGASDWRDVYEEITKNHPDRDDVVDAYKTEAGRASKFLKDNNLVDVPDKYRLNIEETPGYYRSQLPFAAYVPSRLTFWVTVLMNERANKQEIEEQLRAHNYSDIKAVTVHEAFPGHHLDQTHKRAYGQKLDKKDPRNSGQRFLQQSASWDSAPYSEGWGLYAESMMFDNGYYKNSNAKQEASDKLVALRCMLWRSARAFLDAQIHTGQSTADEAVDFLVENLVMPRDRAEAEVNRYVENPGQVTTYYLGMKQFKEIWEKASLHNPDLTLKQFHNDMLKQTLPVPALGLARYGV